MGAAPAATIEESSRMYLSTHSVFVLIDAQIFALVNELTFVEIDALVLMHIGAFRPYSKTFQV